MHHASILFDCLPSAVPVQMRQQTLAKLALMSGRVPVWPSVDCTSKLVGGDPSRTQHSWPAAPFELPTGWMPFYHRGLSQVNCFRMQVGLGLMQGGEGHAGNCLHVQVSNVDAKGIICSMKYATSPIPLYGVAKPGYIPSIIKVPWVLVCIACS